MRGGDIRQPGKGELVLCFLSLTHLDTLWLVGIGGGGGGGVFGLLNGLYGREYSDESSILPLLGSSCVGKGVGASSMESKLFMWGMSGDEEYVFIGLP